MRKIVEYQISKVDEYGDLYDIIHVSGRGSKQRAIKKAKNWARSSDEKCKKVVVERLTDWVSEGQGVENRHYEEVAEFDTGGELQHD